MKQSGNQLLTDPNTLDAAQLKRRAGKTDRVVAYMQMTDTASKIMHKSGCNRPRNHLAEVLHPWAVALPLKVTLLATQAVLFHQNTCQATLWA